MGREVSVSQINAYIKNMFSDERALRDVSVRGEASNCKYHSSGHIYFTIKDASSQLSCVMFSSMRGGLSFKLEDGQDVAVHGSIGVYERAGRYQLYADRIDREGLGRLYEEFDKTKRRLEAEGLFSAERKKKIPKFASSIGVVTSETGAVIRDILNVAKRRNPYVQIYLYPARVQGDGAAKEIMEGLKYFEKSCVDVVIICRGGGSIEDLWAFNDEGLARAVAACKKPVISAVGHETDFTISDFAADLRAPTPSAAAEIAVYPYANVMSALRAAAYSLNISLKGALNEKKMELGRYEAALKALSPKDALNANRLYLAEISDGLGLVMKEKIVGARHRLELLKQGLENLSPAGKLAAGYVFISDARGRGIKSVNDLEKGQKISISMRDGKAEAAVEKITRQ